jgi:hypothetical protein
LADVGIFWNARFAPDAAVPDLLDLPQTKLAVEAPFSSLLANHHRLPGYKRLDARTAKSRLAHPIGALRPAVTEPGVGPQQHIQA